MADTKNIARLHAPEPPPVKLPNFDNFEIDVSTPPAAPRTVSGGFRIARKETEAYTLDPSMILSSMAEAAPTLDRASRFGDLREREHLRQLVQQHLAALRVGVR